MGVSTTIYTGPVVIVIPPKLSESVDVMKCEKCKRRQMDEGAFCSRDGGRFRAVKEKVEVRPWEWLNDLEEDNNIVDYFSAVPDEGGSEVPAGEIWMTPNDTKASYCKYMSDPRQGNWGNKEDPYQLIWIDTEANLLNNPAAMLKSFLEDKKAQAHIEVYRNPTARRRLDAYHC